MNKSWAFGSENLDWWVAGEWPRPARRAASANNLLGFGIEYGWEVDIHGGYRLGLFYKQRIVIIRKEYYSVIWNYQHVILCFNNNPLL